MKNRINIYTLILSLISDTNLSPESSLWKKLLEQLRSRHPFNLSEAELKPWARYPGNLTTMHQVVAVWLRFDLTTYLPGTDITSRCIVDGVIDDKHEIDKEEFRAFLTKQGLPLPALLFPEEYIETPQEIKERMEKSGATESQIVTELCSRQYIRDFHLGSLLSPYPPGHRESKDATRKRGERLRKKHHNNH